MSQAGIVDVIINNPSIPTEFDADVGTAIPIANVLDVKGVIAQGIHTTGAGNTLTITVDDATTTTKGVSSFSGTDFNVAAGVVSINGPISVANGGTGSTSFNINGTVISGPTPTSPLTSITQDNGELIIGSTGAPPVAATLTPPAAGIDITNGPGSIVFSLDDDLAAVENLATIGLVSRTAADTWTTSPISQNSILYGGGCQTIASLGPLTDGQIIVGQSGNAPVATSPTNGNNITWTLGFGTLRADVTGTTDHALQLGNASGSLTSLGVATDGQIPIGSTGNNPVLATLTAGAGIAITNAAGAITITNTSGGFAWTRVAGVAQNIAVQNGYIPTNVAMTTFTLPATATIGDGFQIAGEGTGLWRIATQAGQTIYCGVVTTTTGVGGFLTATHRRDTVEVVCTNTDTEWTVIDFIGNLGAT